MSLTNGAVLNGVESEDGKVVGIDNVNERDASSYMANYKAHKPGISHEEMIKAYTEWADNYDKVRLIPY